ncbi:unnamed protein product [Lymnaea stagnalis]|uniref:Uncharacterized protein n=1 Tax=Lymnaea stagnalis TaxID=6523 RepID=A0AAV2H3T0_LYMST
MAHGYDVPLTCDLDPRLQCPICLLVLCNAIQTTCGHRFCEACIKKVILSKNSILTCPIDKTFSKVEEIFPDVATRREVLSLAIKCTNHNEGCTWQGELRELQNHHTVCSKEKVVCSNGCGAKCRRADIDEHLHQCPSRQVHCLFCGENLLHCKMISHTEKCPKAPVTCTLCGDDKLIRAEIGQHQDPVVGVCPKAIITCPFTSTGCSFKAERHKVEQHTKELGSLYQHMEMAGRKIAEHCNIIKELQKELVGTTKKATEAYELLMANQRNQSQMSKEIRDRNVTGKLHWKVKVGQQRNPRTSYCSPSFYTGCPGYKVQLTLDMDGHKEGHVRYTSLSVTLLPGEYDDDIVFPFNATCYVTLYDQANASSRRVNLTQEIVLREVPRNNRGQSGDRIYRRENNKYISRYELMGRQSRFLKNGFLHFEITVLHSFYPPPEASHAPACLNNLFGHGSFIIHTPTRPQVPPPAQPPVMGVASLAIGN